MNHSPENLHRLDRYRVEPVVKFMPQRWNDLVQESEKKRKHYEGHNTTRAWSRWRELRGLAAEEVVAMMTGLPRHKRLSDGGEDFFKTDVKGIPPVQPVLSVTPVDARGAKIRWVAEYYVCVVVDIREHWGTCLGWATRDEIRDAPLIDMKNARAHVIYPWELHEGLPPELVNYSNIMRAVS